MVLTPMNRRYIPSAVEFCACPLIRDVVSMFACEPVATLTIAGESIELRVRAEPRFTPEVIRGISLEKPKQLALL
jgi:hypothetical protein